MRELIIMRAVNEEKAPDGFVGFIAGRADDVSVALTSRDYMHQTRLGVG